ncbi:MAG: hypothetical protein J5I92_17635 [Thiogranum sp.]|nr:hypothetical protein [Thiogranum sp.]
MNTIGLYADYIVLSILSVVALGLLMFSRHLHRKHARKVQHRTSEFFAQNTSPIGNASDHDETAINTLLIQAIAGMQRAVQTIKETQERLESVSTRIERLEGKVRNSSR